MVGSIRTHNGRNEKTSFIIIDAQSVKNTESARKKGYDAGKKVCGIKRHIAVDTQGLPHAMHITTADFTDRNGAVDMIKNNTKSLSKVQNILADGGYSGANFADEIRKIIGAKIEIGKRNELHKFVVLPKRWVVERSFSWLEKCRRLWKNCEKLPSSSLAMAQLAFIRISLCRKI